MSSGSQVFPIAGARETTEPGWLSGDPNKVRKLSFAEYDPKAATPGAPRTLTEAPPPTPLPQADTSAVVDPVIPKQAGVGVAMRDDLRTPAPGSQSMLPPGTAELAVELEARIEAFASAAADLAFARQRVVAGVEEQLLRLAADVAEALLERELEADPELHHALARSALAELGHAKGATLRASREAFAAITDVYGEPMVRADGVAVQVELDPTLEGLGCIAETEEARVDGRIGERLRAVRRALEDERRRRVMEEGE